MSRIGIIAGGGSLPQKLIDACKRGQRDFFVLALQGQADKVFLGNVPHRWVRIGATDEAISILKEEHVDEVVMELEVAQIHKFAAIPPRDILRA